LDSVLRRLPRSSDPNLLVGFETNDDAGVYLLTADLALVQTVDFFTPIVDDAYTYGQIAAANALSDVYAMGGRPISALSIVGFPPDGAPETLEQIMQGGLSKMTEAQCTVLGGHSVRDDELKFGYAVTGMVQPQRVWRNIGAQPGDVLLLTKPLGTGVIATALKQGGASDAALEASIASMTRLNRDAAAALRELEEARTGPSPVHAVTDVTGFGLLGHGREMALGSAVSFRLNHARIAYLPGAIEASRKGFLAGGLNNNREFVASCVAFASQVALEFQHLLYDPQTSGGLLIAMAPDAAAAALQTLERHAVAAHAIGEVLLSRSPLMEVT
jgi:selenide, water dikinase